MIHGHGDDLYRYPDIRMNFSSNVYNRFDHEGLFEHLAKQLHTVLNYPEPTPSRLERELAAALYLEPQQIMVTSGATEAIYLIAQTWRQSRSAILVPTFSEYADACKLHRHTIRNILRMEDIPSDADFVWICNPNNPTGMVYAKEKLLRMADEHSSTTFVIDASYDRFTDHPKLSAKEAASMPNMLMLHSMTKDYAIPGLRLGYLTGNEELLSRVRHHRMPWSVNQMAIEAGCYLLHHSEEFELPLDGLLSERERMTKALESLHFIEVWPSDSLILLCRLRIGTASALKEYLAIEHGILIRDASNFETLDASFFRIAVQSHDENEQLLNALTEWMAC